MFRRAHLGLLSTIVSLCLYFPAHAATIIRDAEIEQSLRQLARPILQAAGISANRIRILVIRDNSLNAFVTDSRHIFITSSLIRRLNSPEALQAVLAHETAHIANGHLTRRAANARNANRASAIGLALSAVALAAGGGQAAAGLAVGSVSSAQRVFLSHTRAEEASADQSALRYLDRAGIPPSAMLEVLELFRGQEALSAGRQDPYARSHPLTKDRLRAVRGYSAAYKSGHQKTSATSQYWYARMHAKLNGFLGNPRRVLRSTAAKGNGEIATLLRAVAYHRTPKPKKAIAEINKLLKLRPRDPFYHELKGQILLESQHPKAAIASYSQASKLLPSEPLLLAGLGRSYLALNTPTGNKKALNALASAASRDPGDPNVLRDLAQAYARLGQPGQASVATAQRYAIQGDWDTALTHAKRAQGLLPRGSSGWLRAEDIIISAQSRPKGRKRR